MGSLPLCIDHVSLTAQNSRHVNYRKNHILQNKQSICSSKCNFSCHLYWRNVQVHFILYLTCSYLFHEPKKYDRESKREYSESSSSVAQTDIILLKLTKKTAQIVWSWSLVSRELSPQNRGCGLELHLARRVMSRTNHYAEYAIVAVLRRKQNSRFMNII